MTDSIDSDESTPFLGPRLVGKRFVEHSIPLEVLSDLAAIQDILITVANTVYKEQNDAQRGPNNLRRGVSLQLTNVGEGSAVAMLELRIGPDVSKIDDVKNAFGEAKNRLVSALNAANLGDRVAALKALNPDILARFEKLGSSLKPGEFVEFAPETKDESQRARLDTSSRVFLAGLVKEGAPVEQRVEIRGVISAISTVDLGFTIRNFAGDVVPCNLAGNPDRLALTVQATKSVQAVDFLERVVLSGTGLVADNGTVQSIKDVDSLEIVPRHDVLTRIEELRVTTPESFVATAVFSDEKLDWFLKGALSSFNEETGYPAIFIGPDQDLFLEWKRDSYTVSVEIDTDQQDAEIQLHDSETKRSTFEECALESAAHWRTLSDIVVKGLTDGH